MQYKDTYIVELTDADTGITGVGEAPLFRGLSADDTPDYEARLDRACRELCQTGIIPDDASSSIRMGLETAVADLRNGGTGIVFPGSEWLAGRLGIPINGLIWMGDKQTMFERIRQKLEDGFKCLKLKIGGIKFEEELELLSYIRRHFSESDLELRLDANGAFRPDDALSRLERLARYDIHSIEQPIRQGQAEEMARICSVSPIAIALDEELIGDTTHANKRELLAAIRPQYIILKPALCGGFRGADKWIAAAEEQGIGWWVTSALESNVGLSAIGQWVALKNTSMPQGLGTGELYHNNLPTHVRRRGAQLFYEL